MEQTYQYDALDRIEKETVEPEPAFFTVPVALMTHDADDRLDTFNGLQCMSDLDGNLVTGPLGGNVAGFTFDARNRLTAVGNATFVYDSEGRRISKTENGTTTVYVHDLQSALSRLLSASTGNATTFYVYTPGGMLLYEDTPSTIGLRVPHHDYRGSTVALSNTSGTVIGRVVYGTYGEIVSSTGDTDTRFLFHGAYGVETDASGLCLMRARYYNPETRRFLNADPLKFEGSLNWLSYAADPVANVDPLGLRPSDPLLQDPKVQTLANEIWKKSTPWGISGFGGLGAHEHYGFVLRNPDGTTTNLGPYRADTPMGGYLPPRDRADPPNTTAGMHSHWTNDPRPSVGDAEVARKRQRPEYIILKDRIVRINPDGTREEFNRDGTPRKP